MTVLAGYFKILWLIPVIPFLVVNSSDCSLENTTGHKIFFYLYTNRQNKSHFEDITEFKDLANSSINGDWKTIFLIHGWGGDINSEMIQLVKDGYLNLSDYNVIGVDWNKNAGHFFYPTSAGCVSMVANWIGMFIKNLIDPANGLNVTLDKVNLVGHSLGAHIAGIVGAYFRIAEDCTSIPVIIGLDPAGPTFVFQNMYSRLDLHDASYVEVMHTSTTYFGLYSYLQWIGLRPLGMPENVGDVDIYPNYGGLQSHCTNLLDQILGICAHNEAYVLFAYSLNATKHDAEVAVECEGGLDDIEKMKCLTNNNSFYYMGDPEDRMYLSKSNLTSTFGVYYIETLDIVGFWNHCRYYFMIVIWYLVPISCLILFLYWIYIGIKCIGKCKQNDVEASQNERKLENQEKILPESVHDLTVNNSKKDDM